VSHLAPWRPYRQTGQQLDPEYPQRYGQKSIALGTRASLSRWSCVQALKGIVMAGKLKIGNPSPGSMLSAQESAPNDTAWTNASHVATIGLFVIAVLWAVYVAQHVIVPVLLAWVIATIVLPIVKRLEERGVPRVLSSIGVAVVLLAVIACLVVLLSAPLAYWLGRASYIGSLLREKLETFTQPMALLAELQKGLNAIGAGSDGTLKVETQSTSLIATIVGMVTPAVSGFVVFVFSLIFYLTYRQRLRSALVYLLSDRDARLITLRTLNDIDDSMTTYFVTFTIINFCLGIVATVLTWAVGLPNPLLWGMLACVLNFIPYLGPGLVIVTLGVVGLLVFPTLGEAAAAPLLYLIVVTIEGQFITPTFMGKRLEINPFAVFLAIAFCTWFWGPVGAFLAVPLLIALAVTLEHGFTEDRPPLPH
jgi:predicted PurR-regulated permease PerM